VARRSGGEDGEPREGEVGGGARGGAGRRTPWLFRERHAILKNGNTVVASNFIPSSDVAAVLALCRYMNI
jgi:hypothetical protein